MPWDFWIIFLALAVFLPWRGQRRVKRLLALPQIGARERFSLYVSTIAFQWVAVALVCWRAWARGLRGQDLGLVVPDSTAVAIAAVVGTATFALLQWFNLRRVAQLPPEARGFVQSFADRVLPQRAIEFIPFFVLAVTAGVCEEFLFRGFAMGAMSKAGLADWEIVLLSSVLFGLGHLYQGRAGVVSTFVLGIIFGITKIAYDTLAVVVFWHIAVDVVAGVAGYRFLVRPLLPPSEQQIERAR
ncbi:MAG TPA: type II CAAX endopeptidase family protein [Candidatus Saccharimonadales bacterium]|nr:type II CAAX endopeptidase family protein [Candidatus Saccharimonadales bacterium]